MWRPGERKLVPGFEAGNDQSRVSPISGKLLGNDPATGGEP